MRWLPLFLVLGCGPSTLFLRGELVKVERAEQYEPVCNAISRALSHCEDAPRAYDALIVADSAIGKKSPRREWVMFFAPAQHRIPRVGWYAVWVLQRRELWRLAECRGVYGCPSENGWALDSDDAIRPAGDWRKVVDSLRAAR